MRRERLKTRISIDGLEVSNFRTGSLNPNNNLPFQFVQEIQIKTSGFEAEYGGATGGVINVVTKGGSKAVTNIRKSPTTFRLVMSHSESSS